MKKLIYFFIAVLALWTGLSVSAIEADAQTTYDVQVIVSDAQGAMPGASVMVKNTTNGAVTGTDGVALIENISEGAVLVVSSLGYATQEVTFTGNTKISVVLQEDSELIAETIVVGYGVQKKESLTSAISQINAEELQTSKSPNTTDALQGKIPGLLIRNRTGKPGEFSTDLSLRGFGTPMIVVDGVVRSSQSPKRVMAFGPNGNRVEIKNDYSVLNEINPNDIETITVLKDASATIYGLGAENGVILITTKKGTVGKPKVSLQADVTLGQPTRVTDYMDWVDFMKWDNAMADVAKMEHKYTPEQIKGYETGDPNYIYTDWYDVTQKKFAVTQRYNLTVSGGTEKIKYYFGLGYNNDASTMRTDVFKYQRYSINGSITAQLAEGLELRYGTQFKYVNNYTPAGAGTDQNIWYFSMCADPTYPVYVLDNPTHYAYVNSVSNPAALLDVDENGYSRTITPTFNNTLDLKYNVPFVKGLTLSASGAYDFHMSQTNCLEGQYSVYDYKTDEFMGYGSGQWNYAETWMYGQRLYGRIQATYDRSFGNHNVGATFAAEATKFKYAWETAKRQYGTSKDDSFYTHDTLASGLASTQTNDGTRRDSMTAGYIGRINYNYAGKYLVEVMARYDGSYVYAPGKRWGFFPSYSLGWRVSEEPFIKNNLPWLNNLKIRWSDGMTGSIQGNPYDYIGGYTQTGTYVLNQGGITNAWSNTSVENTILTWADVRLMDVGVDWEIFQGLFGGSFDWFKRRVSGLAGWRAANLPDFYGVTLPTENLDVMENEGIELALSHHNKIGEFRYDITASATFSRSRMTYMESENTRNYTSSMDYWKHCTLNRWTDGRAAQTYHWAGGQFGSLDEISNSSVLYSLNPSAGGNNSLVVGTYKLVDRNGNGYIDDEDMFYTWGDNINPPLQFGLNISGAWKGLDFSLSFAGSALRNRGLTMHGYAGFGFLPHLSEGYTDSYHVAEYGADPWDPNTEWVAGKYPALVKVSDPIDNSHNGTYTYNQPYNFLNAAFLRLKNIEVGYNIAPQALKKAGIQGIRVYFNGGNLFTICKDRLKYSDPESDDQNNAGGFFPLMRTYTFGVNFNF